MGLYGQQYPDGANYGMAMSRTCPYCSGEMVLSSEVSNSYICTNPECLTDVFVMETSMKIFHTTADGEVIHDVWIFG